MIPEQVDDEADELLEETAVEGASSSSGRTPRRKVIRTRDGCLTCRKCKKACDKTKPSCLRCQRLSYACEWPAAKPYSQIGTSTGKKRTQQAVLLQGQAEDSAEQAGTQNVEQPAMVMPAYSLSGSSSSTASPAMPVFSHEPTTASSSSELAMHDASTVSLSSARYEPLHSGGQNGLVPSLQTTPGFETSVESPSRALDAQFWNENSLYTFDYNFTDFSDIDSLLRLAGLAPLQPAVSADVHKENVPQTISSSMPSSASQQVILPRDKIKAISKLFPRRVGVLLDRMISEQEGSSEVKLPLAYIVTTCLWAPSSAIRELLQTAKNAYSGPGLQSMLNDLGEVAWQFIANKPAKATKIAIAPEKIAAMDISLSSKLYALMDIAIRQAIVEGAAAYYVVASVMEKLLLKSFKPGHLFNVADLGRIENVHIYNFVFVDIMRAIQLGLPTTFAYHWAPGPDHRPETAFSVGCSDPILCVMSEISALKFLLDRDANARSKDGLNPMYQPKADEIMKKIEANPAIWVEPDIIDTEDGLDSVQHVSSIASQEAWRQAALLHYYHSLYRDAESVENAKQAACRQILTLFPTTQLGKPHRLYGMHGLPIFMAATVANTAEDRKACIDAFDRLSLGSAADKEIKLFFERLWTDSDKAGHRLDWLDYASPEEGPVFI